MIIRPYSEKDKEDVRHICLYCDGPENFSDNSINFLLSTYCDYYIEKEPDNCFVAADDNDKAVGYILCAQDFDSFISCFSNEYFTKIPESDKQHRIYAREANIHHEKHKDEYPAHLHIDIMTDFQRMGLGHRLMDALIEKLRSKNVKGLMLSVASFNKKGLAFYEKYGFRLIEELPDTLVFGLRLN